MKQMGRYEIYNCTVINFEAGDMERQDALYVRYYANGEWYEEIYYNWNMPENEEELNEMMEDGECMTIYQRTIENAIIEGKPYRQFADEIAWG